MFATMSSDQILADLKEERANLAAVLATIEESYLHPLGDCPDLTLVTAARSIKLTKRLRQVLVSFDRLVGDRPEGMG